VLLAGVAWAAIALGSLWPSAATLGRSGVMLGRGGVGFAWGSGPMKVRWPAGSGWPVWQAGPIAGGVVLPPYAVWRPSAADGVMSLSSVTTIGGALVATPPMGSSVRLWWLPLWWPGVLGVLVGMLLLHGARAPRPGHCPGCGYELTGLAGVACPECGGALRKLTRGG
jgi:hypothetical protein